MKLRMGAESSDLFSAPAAEEAQIGQSESEMEGNEHHCESCGMAKDLQAALRSFIYSMLLMWQWQARATASFLSNVIPM